MGSLWLFSGFFTLSLAAALIGRRGIFPRRGAEWLPDASGLASAFLSIFVFYPLLFQVPLRRFLPGALQSLEIGWAPAILLMFVADYSRYWWHRALHSSRLLWGSHLVHHTAAKLDVVVTFRSSLWPLELLAQRPLGMVLTLLARDPLPVSATFGFITFLSILNHSGWYSLGRGRVGRVLGFFHIVTPLDHAWHHSVERPHCNFSTNFDFWDRLHGTWYQSAAEPHELGLRFHRSSMWRQLLFPFGAR